MRQKSRRPADGLFAYDNLTLFMIACFLTLILCGACSKEEQHEDKGTEVVVTIRKPETKPVVDSPVVEKQTTGEKPSNDEKETTSDLIISTVEQKTPSDIITPTIEKKQPSLPETSVESPEEPLSKKDKEGCYKVQEGESLYGIAGRTEVYGDPLKWPSLFRLNMSELSGMNISENLVHEQLPEGLELRFVTSREAEENSTKLGQKIWGINVISTDKAKKIILPAITLMKNGCHVYLTKAEVKGVEWFRLRVGFFKERSNAVAVGKEVMAVLKNVDDAWVVKVGEKEIREFGVY